MNLKTFKWQKALIPDAVIVNKIYWLRGKRVMLDRDLAQLYGIKPIRLREQVKRNADRFPEHFMFQLTEEEVENMVSQNAIPSRKHLGGSLPFAFTEHGVLMLANVLKNKAAIQISIRVIEIFVKLREMLLTHKDILLKIEQMEKKITGHDEEIQMIFAAIKELLDPPPLKRKRIGFKVGSKK